MILSNRPFLGALGLMNLAQLSLAIDSSWNRHTISQQRPKQPKNGHALRSAATSAATNTFTKASAPHRQLQSTTNNDNNDDTNLHFHETTFLSSHNAHANRAVSENFLEALGINQENSIYSQLKFNQVRSLSLDVKVTNNELRLVHGEFLDYGALRFEMAQNLIPFLEEDQDAIVTLDFETYDGEETVVLEGLRSMLSTLSVGDLPLVDMTFKYSDERWSGHTEWPTLGELREANQRVFVFTDRSEIVDEDFGIMFKRDVFQENDWQGIDGCMERYAWGSTKVSLVGKESWTRLFFMNHFCCDTGSESYATVVGEDLIGGGDNGWGVLYPRVEECMASNGGMKPNYISVDWVGESPEALEVVEYLTFGGAVGTGQTCTEDSHCATSSCNTDAGVCQCQVCSGTDGQICAGCTEDEVCNPPGDGEELNVCAERDRTTETFFCGTNYFETQENCNDRKRCPNGNNDCTNGEVCFAGIDCTPRPTLTPTESPSEVPSDIPSLMPSQSPSDGASDAPTKPNTNFCGNDYFSTVASCLEATPCPAPFGDDICVPLGMTCFANVNCPRPPTTPEPTAKPTISKPPSVAALLNNTVLPTAPPAVADDSSSRPTTILEAILGGGSGNSSVPMNGTIVPTSSSTSDSPSFVPSGSPTKAPVQPVTKYCGTSYDEAKEFCSAQRACPRGFECPSGMVCYNGIKCFTKAPTETPTGSPTDSPPPTMSGSKSPTSPPTPAPISPTISPTSRPTKAPFDINNPFFCGANYTHAKDTCYYGTPCPGGNNELCPDGETCFGGIIGCTAPPTSFPTVTPSQIPTAVPVGMGGVNPSEVGGSPADGAPSPSGGPPGDATDGKYSAKPTWGEFDLRPVSGATISGVSSVVRITLSVGMIFLVRMFL